LVRKKFNSDSDSL